MFELYAQNINPDNPEFQTFIKRYVANRDTRGPETIPYSKLYAIIREGIREYLQKKQETEQRLKK
jgi:hypothetical protein